MRAVFAEKTKDDRVTVTEGTFERIEDAEDGWADLVVIAQVSLSQPLVRKKKKKQSWTCPAGIPLVP